MEITYTKRRKTAEQWKQDVQAWRESGLSKAAFCRERGLDYAHYHYRVSQQETHQISKLVPNGSHLKVKAAGLRFGWENSSLSLADPLILLF